MSIAEMKVKIFEKVAASNDEQFIAGVLRKVEEDLAASNGQVFDVDEFYQRMVEEHGVVLQRLAQ